METSTYGYFPMLPFLMRRSRKEKVEWLMDQYTQNKAMYPNAEFSFLGHSNGTYLLAKALKEYPACKFKNVVFAGSVVNADYKWEQLFKEQRIGQFYNFVASSDWVVAVFPKSFQVTNLQDIGSGGFDGFRGLEDRQQLKFIPGSHSAAIEEKYWDEIATFIVHGNFSNKIDEYRQHRSFIMKLIGASAPLPFIFLFVILILTGIALSRLPHVNTFAEIILVELLYLFVIWKVITRL